jgi:Na+-translocating ferredoxin:NAD+ oxidoreductase RNF subunit RnfB
VELLIFKNIFPAVMVIGGLGLVLGAGLSFADKYFGVDNTGETEKILNSLPGINCGACGYPGCGQLAAAISNKQASYDACPVLGKKRIRP